MSEMCQNLKEYFRQRQGQVQGPEEMCLVFLRIVRNPEWLDRVKRRTSCILRF